VVPKIVDSQTNKKTNKIVSGSAKNRTLHSLLHVVKSAQEQVQTKRKHEIPTLQHAVD